ncbi:MAG: RNA polymerase sigma factor [Prosthecobacter sp.]
MTALPASTDLQLPVAEPTSLSDPERENILAAQAGQADAFEWLVHSHEERLLGFCRRWLRCEEDAREACQDAFVRAWQALPEFESRARFSTWLYQIALNACRDRAKAKNTRQRDSTVTLEEIAEAPICPKPSPDAGAEWQGDLDKLQRGLALLPDKLRAALILVTMEGLNQKECAEVLGCSIRGVEGRVHRARQMLLEWWDEEE